MDIRRGRGHVTLALLLILLCFEGIQAKAKRHRHHHHHHHRDKNRDHGKEVNWVSKDDDGSPKMVGRGIISSGHKKEREELHGAERIVGGRDAQKYKYKSVVSIQCGGYTICGGTIIKQDWVLTAAHCIQEDKLNPTHYVIKAGEWNRKEVSGMEQKVKLTKIILHQDFNRESNENDIALMKLATPLEFNDYVKPAMLPSKSYQVEGNVWVVGWGKNGTGEGDDVQHILQEVSLPAITNSRCLKMYAVPGTDTTKKVTDDSLCTFNEGGGKDSCQGDSGGPLYVVEDDVQVVVGIVSWGIECGHEKYPGVSTRVSRYLEWIEKNTKSTWRPVVIPGG